MTQTQILALIMAAVSLIAFYKLGCRIVILMHEWKLERFYNDHPHLRPKKIGGMIFNRETGEIE